MWIIILCGTEQFSNDKTSPRHWHVSYSARVVHKYVLPSLRLSVRTRFYYTQFHIFVTRVLHIFPSIHSCSAMKSLNFDLLSTVVSPYFTLFGCLGCGFFFFFFFFFFLVWIFPEQLFLSCTVLSKSACCKNFFF